MELKNATIIDFEEVELLATKKELFIGIEKQAKLV